MPIDFYDKMKEEKELLDISMKESIRQKEERTPSEEMQDKLEPIPCPMHKDYDLFNFLFICFTCSSITASRASIRNKSKSLMFDSRAVTREESMPLVKAMPPIMQATHIQSRMLNIIPPTLWNKIFLIDQGYRKVVSFRPKVVCYTQVVSS